MTAVYTGLGGQITVNEAAIVGWYLDVPSPAPARPWASRHAHADSSSSAAEAADSGPPLDVCARCPVQPACLEHALARS